MHTDEEIVRLLRYGLEGIHYRKGEDGLEEVKTAWAEARSLPNGNYAISHGIKTWGYPGNFTLGNPRLPLELDELAGIRHRDDAGFYGDVGGVVLLPCPEDLPEGSEETMKKIRDILYVERGGALNEYSFGDLWEEKKESCEQELERMQAAFAEAGYNELIGELNRRLK